MGRFLADNRRLWQQAGEPCGKDFLALMISHSDDIIRRLVLDLVRGERLVVWKDSAGRGVLHDGLDGAGEGVH